MTTQEDLRCVIADISRQCNEYEAALRQALEALNAVRQSYGIVLASYPPQDAWAVRGVDHKVSTAIASIQAALHPYTPTENEGSEP